MGEFTRIAYMPNAGATYVFRSKTAGTYIPVYEPGDSYEVVEFNASRASDLYSGSSLQNKALQLLPCIRY